METKNKAKTKVEIEITDENMKAFILEVIEDALDSATTLGYDLAESKISLPDSHPSNVMFQQMSEKLYKIVEMMFSKE
jgi:hypothetical protein